MREKLIGQSPMAELETDKLGKIFKEQSQTKYIATVVPNLKLKKTTGPALCLNNSFINVHKIKLGEILPASN